MLTLELRGENLYVRLTGELDHSWAPQVREKIDAELATRKYRRAIFDFAGLTFMDSTGVGLLIGRYKRLKELGREMVVDNVNPQIDKVLTVSGIYKIVPKVKKGA